MPGVEARLPGGVRLSDLMSVMLLARVFPVDRVKAILQETGRESQRERRLPASLMVYYVMALALYMQVSYQEILRLVFEAFNWLSAHPADQVQIAAKSAIAKARERLGPEPFKQLYRQFAGPIATEETQGAFFRGWRLVSLDGSTLDVGDTDENVAEFGRPGVSRGEGSAYPKLRFCSLVENGTHVFFGAMPGPYRTGETTLAQEVVQCLATGMLCLADRNFYSYALWTRSRATGADLLWRVKGNLVLPCEKRLPDGSYLSTVYPSVGERRRRERGRRVRIIEFRLTGEEVTEDATYRLITTILDADRAPALELAALYSERWEIETALDEFKTHLRGRGIVLRSKTKEGVYQEFWGFMLAHHAVRSIMHDAAVRAQVDPDRLSFVHAVSTIKRKLPFFLVTPPQRWNGQYEELLKEIAVVRVPPRKFRVNKRGVKRKMSNYPLRHREPPSDRKRLERPNIALVIYK